MATKKTDTITTAKTTTEATKKATPAETTASPAADDITETVKAKVLRTYRDKESLSIQKTGTVVELSEARFKELSKLGYVRKA